MRVLFLLSDFAPSHVASKLVLLPEGILVHPLQVAGLLERYLRQLLLGEVVLLGLCGELGILSHCVHLLGSGRAQDSVGSRDVL